MKQSFSLRESFDWSNALRVIWFISFTPPPLGGQNALKKLRFYRATRLCRFIFFLIFFFSFPPSSLAPFALLAGLEGQIRAREGRQKNKYNNSYQKKKEFSVHGGLRPQSPCCCPTPSRASEANGSGHAPFYLSGIMHAPQGTHYTTNHLSMAY